MKKFLVFLIFGIFLLNFSSALLEVSRPIERPLDLEISESAMKYNAIEIIDNWDLPLISKPKAELVLTDHTESCGIDCLSEFQITTFQESALIDDIKFYTLIDDGVKLDEPREQNIRSYSLSYWGNIIDYETKCIDGGTIVSENGTSYTPQECSQVEVSSHEGWVGYTLGQELPAGTYQVKLTGEKRPTREVDWVLKTNGVWTTEWALWGSFALNNGLVPDVSGNNNNGTAYGGVNQTVGTVGNYALQFDGVNDYVQANPTMPFKSSSNNDMSSCFWVNTNNLNVSNGYSLINGYNSSYSTNSLRVILIADSGSHRFGVNFYNSTGASLISSPQTTQIIPFLTWTQLCFTKSGTNVSSFINGVFVKNSTMSSETDLNIDGIQIAKNIGTQAYYLGMLDEVRIYNRSLSASEISTLYAKGSVSDGLVAHYDMEEFQEFNATAEVRLNSPANNSIQYTRVVTTNSSANVTNGAYLVNATLYDNSTGSWGARNTTSSIGNILLLQNTTEVSYSTNGVYTLRKTLTINNKVQYVLSDFKGSGDCYPGSNERINFTYTNGTKISQTVTNIPCDSIYRTYQFNNSNAQETVSTITVEIARGASSGTVYENNTRVYSPYAYNGTVNFTNTYASGSNILWNYQFCDSDGDCGFSTSNYTFSVDNVAPTIALNYPTALINYGAINQTLQLNFTATDTNLDKVWYNYNGTNITIAGAVSGVYNLSNITLSTKKNVTIYANDTAGNLNATTFSWDYKVFENSHNYVNLTYSRVSNQFITNITSPNISTIKINYDGLNYSTTSYTSGSNTIAIVNIAPPVISADRNITFYWIYDLLDSSTVVSPSYNQTIKYIAIGNNYSNSIYNISIRDEFNNNVIPNSNVSVEYSITYGFDNSSILGTSYFSDKNNTNKNISSNIGTQLYLSGSITYTANGYIGRTYTFIETNISAYKNVTLYLSPSNISYVKTILVTDEAGRGKPALYKQYTLVGGVKSLVASEQLDSTGKSVISFIPNIQYTFDFSVPGCSNLTKGIIFYDQSDYVQVLSCSAYNPGDYTDPFSTMKTSFYPDGIFYVDNTTNASNSLFSVNVSGSSSFCSTVDIISFSVYDQNGNLIVSDTSSSCSVLYGAGFFSTFATGKVELILNTGEKKTVEYRWIKSFTDVDYSNYSILELISDVGNSDDILGIDWRFKLLFCFIGLFGVIISLAYFQRIYNYSNLPILIVCDIYLWFMCFIGWGDIHLGATGGGITSLISKYSLFILAIIATVAIVATKEDEYS